MSDVNKTRVDRQEASDEISEVSVIRSGSAVERSVIRTANELLESLEESHRSDLALHLYSSYLLKHLLYKANEKKYPLEVDQFIRTQIKDNWTSWPNSKTIIDPQTDKLYEDGTIISNLNCEAGEVSSNALKHASCMLKQELDSSWQRCLNHCISGRDYVLDVDRIEMPLELANNIIDKLDHLFEGLHHKVAEKNKIELQQVSESHELKILQLENACVKGKKRPRLKYHDIISRACEMGENMTEIYMKSLELYNDIPGTIKKNQFKLPKAELKRYRPAKSGKPKIEIMRKTKEDYLELEKLFKDKRLTVRDKTKLKKVTRRKMELLLGRKNFFEVKASASYGSKEDQMDTGDDYSVDDALIKIPRR